MNPSAAEVSATVEYSLDKWQMDRIPWALWFCVAGLVICLHVGGRGGSGAALAFFYLALLGLAFAGWAGTQLIERSGYPWYAIIPISILIAIIIAAFISIFGSDRGYPSYGRLWWSQLVHPPLNVFGWMLIYLGGGWIAFAIYRHFYPGRPVVRLTPAGLSFHRSWLRDVFIPWPDVQGAGPLEVANPGGALTIYPHTFAVSVTADFYERHIAPKRSALSPPGSETMFRAKGSMMQMVLTSPELIVEFDDYRGPVEARWKAYRDQATAAHAPGFTSGTPLVFGRWSIDGSWWQSIMFLAPLLGMAAVVMHANGIWPT
jgi:hypothetical protein